MTLAEIVNAYIVTFRGPARREISYYSTQGSLGTAIHEAALSRLPSGKRHPHQRRLSGGVLAEAERRLQEAKGGLLTCKSFDELHEKISFTVGQIRGIGDLTVYDIAHRIGGYLGLKPDLLYLHAGTSLGASALGISGRKARLNTLPPELLVLTPAEIEDCLCIYKDALRKLDCLGTDADMPVSPSACFYDETEVSSVSGCATSNT